MKYILLIKLSVLLTLNVSSQPKVDLSNDCSNRMAMVSYYWKIDSIGTNGYRLCAFNQLIDCNLSDVTKLILFQNLGRPNKVDNDETGVYYIYYIFNGPEIPKSANLVSERISIVFPLRKEAKYVSKAFKDIH